MHTRTHCWKWPSESLYLSRERTPTNYCLTVSIIHSFSAVLLPRQNKHRKTNYKLSRRLSNIYLSWISLCCAMSSGAWATALVCAGTSTGAIRWVITIYERQFSNGGHSTRRAKKKTKMETQECNGISLICPITAPVSTSPQLLNLQLNDSTQELRLFSVVCQAGKTAITIPVLRYWQALNKDRLFFTSKVAATIVDPSSKENKASWISSFGIPWK